MGGSIRFSEATRLPPETDFSRWPGVHVQPGKFKSPTDKPRDSEVWERYRDRFRRLQTRRGESKDDHATFTIVLKLLVVKVKSIARGQKHE